ncbi:MAG TPA: GtrA family protein [Alcaligenes sp.]|nr:GtrA family protein [Alcaligenes sp.]
MKSTETPIISTKTSRQLISYALIGLLSNGIGYGFYLVLTGYGLPPKLTVTTLYAISASIGFFANRHITFRHHGHIGKAGIRYIATQLSGYVLNITLLAVFYDWLGFPHQFVQAAAIFIVAIFLFIASRIFVFTAGHDSNSTPNP